MSADERIPREGTRDIHDESRGSRRCHAVSAMSKWTTSGQNVHTDPEWTHIVVDSDHEDEKTTLQRFEMSGMVGDSSMHASVVRVHGDTVVLKARLYTISGRARLKKHPLISDDNNFACPGAVPSKYESSRDRRY